MNNSPVNTDAVQAIRNRVRLLYLDLRPWLAQRLRRFSNPSSGDILRAREDVLDAEGLHSPSLAGLPPRSDL